MAGNSMGLKSTEKGSSWLPEMLVNNIDFCRKKRAALQLCEVLESGILGEERLQFEPGRLRLDEGEILLRELGTTKSSTRICLHIDECSSALQRYKIKLK